MATVQHRIGVIFGLFFVLLVVAAARTLYLGTVRAGTLRKAAQTQQLSTETLPAQRGTITDRNGVDLAVSEPAQDISATPYLVKDPLKASQQLAPLLEQTQAQVLTKLSEHTGFVYLARALPARQARMVMALKLEGITGAPTMRRVYPRGTLAAQVLGFVGTEGNGLTGLEYSQGTLLKGTAGERRVVSDALGQPISISNVHAEHPGATLTLTLDANIQQRAEDVLDAVGRVFSPKDATAIVIDPRTGTLLAVANWPQVNANDPSASTPSAQEDRAVGFNYEPGSTFKAVTVSGALQEGLITPSTGSTSPIRSRSPTARSTTTPNTPTRRSRPRKSSRSPATWALSRSANWRAPEPLTAGCTDSGSARARGSNFRARKRAVAAAERILGLVDGQPADRPGRAGDTDADGERVLGDRQRRCAAPPAHHRRDRRPQATRAAGAPRDLTDHGRGAAHDAEGRARPGGNGERGLDPGLSAGRQDGHGEQDRPGDGRILEKRVCSLVHGLRPGVGPEAAVRGVVDEPQAGSIFGGAVAAPAFGQIMSFALPYLRIPPG